MIARPLAIARDHPAYAGHFPGAPILPAVVLLAEALAAVTNASGTEARDWSVAQAKFLRAVLPGTDLTVAHEATPEGGVRFEIASAEGVVATGTFARVAAP